MNLAIAIGGLAFLILIHELGHFVTRTGREDAAAAVLHLLPARAREVEAQRHRVRHRLDPARRLREDSRDAPPGPDGRRRPLPPGARRVAVAAAVRSTACDIRSSGTTSWAARAAVPELRADLAAGRPERPGSAQRREGAYRHRGRALGRRVLAGAHRRSGSRSSSPGRLRTSSSRILMLAVVFVLGVPAGVTRRSARLRPTRPRQVSGSSRTT